MAKITLREMTKDNYMTIHKLGVKPEQEKFVATNAQSLSQSQFHEDAWALHSAAWWHDHWQRTGIVDVEFADTMPDGITMWQQWANAMGDCSRWYLDTLAADAGQYLGYIRMIGRRKEGVQLEDYCWPDTLRAWPIKYEEKPLFRDEK